ncbi:MAG: beta-propeller fold lactonase family protein [Gemmatimonadales bacterium]|nr:beta-propeller fold lactonase family protein [Gemmatimonadales bacterium]
MRRLLTRSAAFASAALVLALGACSDRSSVTEPDRADALARKPASGPGAVYVQTNTRGSNHVVVYGRAADGTLKRSGTFRTGGRGTGDPRLPSQGSVILSDDDKWLLVANVGSSEISVFAVSGGDLTLTDKVPSGGQMPFSLTLRGNLLYVLNAGGRAGGSDNITAFTLSAVGQLSPLSGSTRPLSAANTDPAQVQFSPDGGTLVVTEKATDRIDTYAVGADGRASGPTVDDSNGDTPFGFAFTTTGYFVVTEAFDKAVGQAAASSYRLSGATGIEVVSGTVRNGETDVCWTVITRDDRYAFITNFGSGTLSSYGIGNDGTLTLIDAVAARTSAAQGPRDLDLSADGRFLYVIDVGTHRVSGYEVESDGSLTAVDQVGGLPPTIAGLAAR